MTIVRWNPFAETQTQAPNNLWTPMTDILETKEAMVVEMEIPGIDREKIDLRLENNVLTVRGERKFKDETKAENYHRVERSYGSFSRSFSLPVIVNQEQISAEYKDGILRITLPKKEQAKSKRIEISNN